jgi:hypothetical protein
MKLIALAAAAAFAITPTASFAAVVNGGANNQHPISHDNPSSCMGAERSSQNSIGGFRDQGGFGPEQSAYVQYLMDQGTYTYGQWLQEVWKPDCPSTSNGGGSN